MSADVYLVEQFETEEQQHEAAQLGVWVFLGTEVMLFSGLFAGILIYRITYWQALQTATEHLHVPLGAINTALLLTSSLTMGFASARGARRPDRQHLLVADRDRAARSGLPRRQGLRVLRGVSTKD